MTDSSSSSTEQRAVPSHHSDSEPLRPGWSSPKPEHVPRPTYWPAVMGVGITMLGWGFIATPLISLAGLLLFGLALSGWIWEIRHEQE